MTMRIVLLALFMSATHVGGMAQCLSNGLTLSTQSAVDAFPMSYPGCTIVEGNVRITGSDISNLDSLAGLNEIRGLLDIDQCTALTSVELPQLTTLGGAIISNNGNLLSIHLNALTQSTEWVLVHDNDRLHVATLPTLTEVDGTLYFYQNRDLEALDINAITRVDENLTVLGCIIDSLVLPDLMHVGGDLSITINDSMRMVKLPGLTEVNGNVSFGFMDQLRALEFSAIEHIGGGLSIQFMERLTEIPAFPQLQGVGGNLKLNECRKLQNLNFAESITEVGGFVQVSALACSDLHGLHNITNVPGAVYIGGNTKLTRIDSFWNIQSIGGNFTLIGSSVLTNGDALRALEHIGGSFNMTWTLLDNIDMLENVQVIDGEIGIRFNHMLLDLSGIAQIAPEAIDHLRIEQNNLLSECDVESICTYLQGPGSHEIGANLTGCNTATEIINACSGTSSTGSVPDHYGITISPNPATTAIRLEGAERAMRFRIYTIMGQQMDKGIWMPGQQLDISHLRPGVISVVLDADSGPIAIRVVVQK